MLAHSQICNLVAESYKVPATWQCGNDVRAVGAQHGDEFVVAIPGTVNLAQWMIDFSAWPKPYPYVGMYHEGFGLWGLKLADLVLPDTTYLERHDAMSLLDRPISEFDGPCDSVRVPVLPPSGQCRP